MKKSFLLLFAGFLSILSCKNSAPAGQVAAPAANTLTDAEKAEGWQLLFDGTTKNGWHIFNQQKSGEAWEIVDSTLHLSVKDTANGKIVNGGNLTTDADFENFHLKLEWKISPNGNSGIMFLVQEDSAKYDEPYKTGPEMQVLHNEGHVEGKNIKHRAGDLYDLISCAKETVKPVGEWNQAEIMLQNGKLDFFLNGEKVVSTTMWDDNWKAMVAASKFNEWPDFGVVRSGKICLQDHDNEVWYRNIKIRRL